MASDEAIGGGDKRAAPAPPAKTTAPAKRARGSKRDPWTDEELLTSAKSKLVDVDLATYFARPEAWDVLSAEEQQHLRDMLPPHTPYDARGRPTFEFLRYDENWRTGIRLFQEDLGAGRYEREWIEAAELAMKERAEGKFDAYKEEQFEQHWGQKSNVDPQARAREMAKVTLERMITDGEFRIGDVWTYAKPLGRGKARFLLEKDVTIVAVGEKTVTALISLGQRRRIWPQHQDAKEAPATRAQQSDHAPTAREPPAGKNGEHSTEQQPSGASQKLPLGPAKPATPTESAPHHPLSASSSPLSDAISVPTPVETDLPALPEKPLEANGAALSHEAMAVDTPAKTRSSPPRSQAAAVPEESVAVDSRSNDRDAPSNQHGDTSPGEPMSLDEPPTATTAKPDTTHGDPTGDPGPDDAAIEYVVAALPMLERAIVEADGRLANWDGRGGNQWRTFRCVRDGQDRGTLWDMKERYAERKGLLSTMYG